MKRNERIDLPQLTSLIVGENCFHNVNVASFKGKYNKIKLIIRYSKLKNGYITKKCSRKIHQIKSHNNIVS